MRIALSCGASVARGSARLEGCTRWYFGGNGRDDGYRAARTGITIRGFNALGDDMIVGRNTVIRPEAKRGSVTRGAPAAEIPIGDRESRGPVSRGPVSRGFVSRGSAGWRFAAGGVSAWGAA